MVSLYTLCCVTVRVSRCSWQLARHVQGSSQGAAERVGREDRGGLLWGRGDGEKARPASGVVHLQGVPFFPLSGLAKEGQKQVAVSVP